jgi:glycosyltransferase involved in cell wall biosynthesis
LLFLFPLLWRPEKANFARRFERLSGYARGSIFAPSGSRQRGLAIGRFRFYSEPAAKSTIGSFVARLRLQVWLPFRMFWWRERVDAVITYDPYDSGIKGILLKWLLGAKLVVEVNGDHHQMKPSTSPLKNWIMGLMLRASLSQADAIKVVNTSLERYLRIRFPDKPIFCFLDFVADGYFRNLESQQGEYLLSVGYPFEFKGVAELIQAFHIVAERHPHLTLRIMGYCPEEKLQRYRELARSDPRIQFVPAGWIEDVGEQMRNCYALVNASHFDAAPRVNFEAMACRKPVISTRTNGALDYVDDGITGLLCEIADVQDLARKLDKLASDPDSARAMGRAGFERLEREFAEPRYLERYLAMLEAIGVRSQGSSTSV